MADRLTDRFRRLLQDQRGFALVIALGVTVVLSMTVVTVIEAAQSNQRSATMSSGIGLHHGVGNVSIERATKIATPRKRNP